MKEWSRDTLSWDTLDVNAYYAADLNRLVIPLPFVQYPVFELGYPRPYSYGSIGMIMAHELFHGFDSGGKITTMKANLSHGLAMRRSRNLTKAPIV